MNKKLMILGASILQLPAITQAKDMGLEVVAVDMNPNAIGFETPAVIREVISTIDIPAVVACAKKHKIDGVMTLASDMPMRTVAAVAKELGLVGIDSDTAHKATNKAAMRQALQEANVPVPKFFKVSSREEYENAVQAFSVPFIVKPADNSGSRGIYLVADICDKDSVAQAYAHSHAFSRNGDVVVEEYMVGQEVSVETLTVDGVCHVIQITDKITTGAPHFVEMGHTQPSALSAETKEKIVRVAKAANRAIGIDNGPSHTEIMVTEEGPKIVELGARLGGDCITTHLVPLSTGVDMVKCCIQIALGETPDIASKYSKASAIRYLPTPAGTIRSISGVAEAEELPGVRQVSLVYGVGDTLKGVQSSADRLGFVVAQADTRQETIEICEKATDCIKIEMEEAP